MVKKIVMNFIFLTSLIIVCNSMEVELGNIKDLSDAEIKKIEINIKKLPKRYLIVCEYFKILSSESSQRKEILQFFEGKKNTAKNLTFQYPLTVDLDSKIKVLFAYSWGWQHANKNELCIVYKPVHRFEITQPGNYTIQDNNGSIVLKKR